MDDNTVFKAVVIGEEPEQDVEFEVYEQEHCLIIETSDPSSDNYTVFALSEDEVDKMTYELIQWSIDRKKQDEQG